MAEKTSKQPGPQFPPLDIPAELQIEYVNIVRIAHSISELIFDFAQLLPGSQSASVQSRIVMSPLGAKLLLRALADNLTKYEASFGEISIPSGSSLAENLFRHTQPPDKPEE